MDITFRTADFEGPLDLLLHLISKHKLNIYNIEITSLLEQYLSYIDGMQQADLDLSSEFLEMAARLVRIKTSSLLPRHEEEAEVLRKELIGELLEYEAYRAAADMLRNEYIGGDIFCRQPSQVEADTSYRRTHPSSKLVSSFISASGRGGRRLPPPESAFSGIVKRRIVSVSSRIIAILRRLYRGQVSFSSLFYESRSDRCEAVATFLALLELIRAHRVVHDDVTDTLTLLR